MSMRSRFVTTGVLRIDREHETLSEMLEHARAICEIANADSCLGCTRVWRFRCSSRTEMLVETLAAYMSEHFKYEEEQMDGAVPHDHMVAHRGAHNEISAHVRQVLQHCRREDNPAVSVRFLIGVLTDWLANHAREHDLVLAAFIGKDSEPPDENLID
jgi:hemerythrin-like metal-binding protein